ncbi:MAG: PD40 domain-containing protein [Planctomycetaceae bacterium]|nr:PD40 domain-containing protein [Planctomycetaceae bacterium]
MSIPDRIHRTSFCAVTFLLFSTMFLPDEASGGETTRTWRKLTDTAAFKQRPVWSPDGSRLLFAQHDLDTIFLFERDTETGAVQRLTDRNDPEYDAVYSPDGSQAAFSFDKTSPNQGDIEVYRIDLKSKELKPVATGDGKLSHEEWATWSPDGKQIAFSSTREGNQELHVTEIDGGDWVRLTSDPGIDAHPAWSPDGKSIAFSTNRWGDLEIATVAPDGTGLQRLTFSSGLDDYPAWSPDGSQLAYTTNRYGSLDICIRDVSTRQDTVFRFDESIENFPSWTPDGKLTFVSNRDGGFEIYVME